MSSRRKRGEINLPAPYLRRVWLDASRITAPEAYPRSACCCSPKAILTSISTAPSPSSSARNGNGQAHAPDGISRASASHHGDARADPDGLSQRAKLLRLSRYGLEPVTLEQTEHFRLIREFCADPALFLETMLAE